MQRQQFGEQNAGAYQQGKQRRFDGNYARRAAFHAGQHTDGASSCRRDDEALEYGGTHISTITVWTDIRYLGGGGYGAVIRVQSPDPLLANPRLDIWTAAATLLAIMISHHDRCY